ncbi:MAG: hypothetical protein JW996_00030 [Candidatus Cloacimonetes bacterium]|nr:hypothetical protein [Candidatus Cloacimonadota bacterium]
MFFSLIKSERGFGLIHVLGMLIIVTVAIVGLFISTNYARYKANENYHYRSALLVAAEKMEIIKCYNRLNDQTLDVNSIPVLYQNQTAVLDSREGKEVIATIPYPPRVIMNQGDITVAPYVRYDSVIIEVIWTEPTDFFIPSATKRIELREDYFRKPPDEGN